MNLEQLKEDYGISIDQAASTLVIDSDDDSLYDNNFEIEIRTTAEEEPDWFNTTLVKVSFQKPPCEVSQNDIDQVAAGIETLQVNATRGSNNFQLNATTGLDQAQVSYA